MKTYGQFCPVAKAAELFCERWTPLIIRDLGDGELRFSQLQRGVPLMSPSLLSRRLRELQAEGIVERHPDRRGGAYRLTPAGLEFVPLVMALGTWGQRWARRQLEEHEVDLGLLIWSLERSVVPAALGSLPSVVSLVFSDQPSNSRQWWFLNEVDGCQVCLQEPGFEVTLHLRCTLPDMIRIVRGDLPLARAVDCGRLDVIGSYVARRRLRHWLNLSPLAAVKSQRDVAER